ncbi:hypothetical protein L0F63_006290, partial [Massospora cicadina]
VLGHAGSAAHGHAFDHDHTHINKLALLFPHDSPRINAFLATFYISIVPNLLLLFVPANIKGSSLNVLVSFAVGGLLGDVFLHLIPHTFQKGLDEGLKLGADDLVKRNICLGLAIFLGVSLFYVIDKVMRILSGATSHSHSHSHSHETPSGKSTSVAPKETKLRQRKVENQAEPLPSTESAVQSEVKHSAYLNLMADFSHNFTDGLAIAASFYISKTIGITTTLAVFFHEIPHEIGDFAILLQAGFSRASAMYSQFFTALGAFLGTVAGVLIQEALTNSAEKLFKQAQPSGPLTQFPITPSELVLPITAGGFLYIATSSVIPELLETPADFVAEKEGANPSPVKLLFQLAKEMLAMILGVGLMALVSLAE